MIQKEFAAKAVEILRNDQNVLGLAVGGSWLTGEMDEFSDLDLVLVTTEKIGTDKSQMQAYADRLGQLLSAFTGEHVGEPRVLICLYDNPLLHVDIKFLTLDEFRTRIETPILLLDKAGQLKNILALTQPALPLPDFQWIEDRFWTWVHYALLKIGRGEYMEAFDFFSYLRMVVLGPLLHLKNNHLPRGVRKVEMQLPATDFQQLRGTLPAYSKTSLLESLMNAINLYKELRRNLYPANIRLQAETEKKVIQYFERVK